MKKNEIVHWIEREASEGCMVAAMFLEGLLYLAHLEDYDDFTTPTSFFRENTSLFKTH
jgi:hypothetical protein